MFVDQPQLQHSQNSSLSASIGIRMRIVTHSSCVRECNDRNKENGENGVLAPNSVFQILEGALRNERDPDIESI